MREGKKNKETSSLLERQREEKRTLERAIMLMGIAPANLKLED